MKLKLNIKKAKKAIRIFLFFLAENIFLSCLIMFLLALIFSGAILFRTFLIVKSENYELFSSLKLEKEEFDNIQNFWQKEKERLDNANQAHNIFYKTPSAATSE